MFLDEIFQQIKELKTNNKLSFQEIEQNISDNQELIKDNWHDFLSAEKSLAIIFFEAVKKDALEILKAILYSAPDGLTYYQFLSDVFFETILICCENDNDRIVRFLAIESKISNLSFERKFSIFDEIILKNNYELVDLAIEKSANKVLSEILQNSSENIKNQIKLAKEKQLISSAFNSDDASYLRFYSFEDLESILENNIFFNSEINNGDNKKIVHIQDFFVEIKNEMKILERDVMISLYENKYEDYIDVFLNYINRQKTNFICYLIENYQIFLRRKVDKKTIFYFCEQFIYKDFIEFNEDDLKDISDFVIKNTEKIINDILLRNIEKFFGDLEKKQQKIFKKITELNYDSEKILKDVVNNKLSRNDKSREKLQEYRLRRSGRNFAKKVKEEMLKKKKIN